MDTCILTWYENGYIEHEFELPREEAEARYLRMREDGECVSISDENGEYDLEP